ncbi:stage II sporulation protein R [Aneurinibacillus tyrosinisolvens]|uniref:stage II sporulation protein R n=1 Tax=Aneurinibacillus tyrosinisolvens TaxID=1443435 RepID=UPI00063EE532|nr:stage II sporulation protein R [Aneurinibacillus tyrosinisolvens]
MKKFYLLFFSLFILLMNWESQKEVLAIFTQSAVPSQSIRLRILANSDSPEDQQLKRQVRDKVIASVGKWADTSDTLANARIIIGNHLPELQNLVNETIKEKGFQYPARVELTMADFPTKMYGTQVFPAGKYEAVRITIGQAEGQNWWCVLFPPLCFVDISNGDAVAQKDSEKTKQTQETKQPEKKQEEPQVRFFLVELFNKIFS